MPTFILPLFVVITSILAWLIAPGFQALAGNDVPKKSLVAGLPSLLEKEGYCRIPLHTMKCGLVQASVRIKGESLRFVVDTGAQMTSISALNNEKLDLKWRTTGLTLQTYSGDFPHKLSEVECLEIEDFKIKSITVCDLGQINMKLPMGDSPIDGLIGADILGRHRAIIDYANRKLYLQQGVSGKATIDALKLLTEDKQYVSIPLQRFTKSGDIAVEVSIDGKRLLLLVDTGAAYSLLNPTRAKGLGLKWSIWPGEERDRDGNKLAYCEVAGMKLGSVKTAPLIIWNDEFIPYANSLHKKWGDPLVDGVLGTDVLDPHQAIIDYRNNRLFLCVNVVKKMGCVKLVNNYPEELTLRVNGVAHRVAPVTEKVVANVPVGEFRYEIYSTRWGVLDSRTAVLHDGEVYILKAD